MFLLRGESCEKVRSFLLDLLFSWDKRGPSLGRGQLVTSAENGTVTVSSEAVVSNCLGLGCQLNKPPHSLWVNLERGFVSLVKSKALPLGTTVSSEASPGLL